jgi:hypothetical protein
VNRVLWDLHARLAVPDPLLPADVAAIEAKVAERRNKRATLAALQAELAATTVGSPAHAEISADILEYGRAQEEADAADVA